MFSQNVKQAVFQGRVSRSEKKARILCVSSEIPHEMFHGLARVKRVAKALSERETERSGIANAPRVRVLRKSQGAISRSEK